MERLKDGEYKVKKKDLVWVNPALLKQCCRMLRLRHFERAVDCRTGPPGVLALLSLG